LGGKTPPILNSSVRWGRYSKLDWVLEERITARWSVYYRMCTLDVSCTQCRTEASRMVSLHLNRLQNPLSLVHDSNMYFHKKAAALKARFFFFSFLCHELGIWNGADLNNDIFRKTAAPEYFPANTLGRHTQGAGIINAYLYNQTRLNTCIWLFVQTHTKIYRIDTAAHCELSYASGEWLASYSAAVALGRDAP